VNFLEQLAAEWYEFRGYFVRRNIRVGRLPNGGFEGELDVVAFHPVLNHFVHIEASADSDRWTDRETRFARKFEVGRKYIPSLFDGLTVPKGIEQIALLLYGSNRQYSKIGGGDVLMIKDFMGKIRGDLLDRHVANAAVPEQYPRLRALQFAADFWP
jgi:hypothetical protein